MKKLFSFLFLLGITFSVFAQNIEITGVVIAGEDNYPLPGVNVVVKGTTNGVITDLDGRFTLNAPPQSILSISYVGYSPQEVVATGNHLEIVLREETELLDELVVIGYGVQKKSVVTAAISRVSAEDLNATKPSRVEDALKGKVSGVQITQSSGQPGAESKVRIRGIGTVNDSDPLYIVDGMPVDGGINYLNPADIQSVEILKDAASAAIYGTRGANGVVLVTTKGGSGAKGKASINYDFSFGWQNPWRKKSVLNAKEYMVIMNEAQINDGNAPRYSLEQIASAGKGTDWQDEVFNYDAPVQSHQVSINGASDKVSYFLSLGYFNQEGIVGGNYGKSNYDRWSLRSNGTYTVFEDMNRKFLNKVRVGVNLGYSRGNTTSIEANSEYGSILGSAISFSPLVNVYASETEAAAILKQFPTAVKDNNGNVFSLPPSGYQELANPVALLHQPSSTKDNEDKFVGTFWGEIDIVSGLKFKSSYGADLAFWGVDAYDFPYYLGSMKKLDISTVRSEMNRGYRWQVENVFTYNNTFAQKHNLTVVLGQSAQKYTVRKLSGEDFNLLETNPDKANINYAIADRDKERTKGGTDGTNFTSLASYFGRLDYNFDERYMVQVTVRRDGSSKFGANNKWATFPAVSLGWNVTNESFLANRPDWFDLLKLRGSWGRNGNERIGDFRYTSLMDGEQNYYFGGGYIVSSDSKGGVMQYGSSPAAISNPDIKWEESEQIDLGFDLRLFKNAFTFGFDYYSKKTIGMLKESPIAKYVGLGAPMANGGEMKNWGLEFEAGWKQTLGDFSYSISANATYMKNKLVNLGNESGEENYQNGGSSGIGDFVRGKNGLVYPYFYGLKTDGIFQNQAEVDAYVNSKGEKLQPKAKPGDVRFIDYDENGTINNDDKTKIGKGMPDWTFGFTLGAEWKGIDLNLFFQGTVGNDIFDFAQRGDIPAMNRASWVLDRWIGEGTSTRIPRMTAADENGNWNSSDLYIKNGGYLRLKTAQLGYTLPMKWTKKVSVQKLRVYVSAENLLTFTKYEGFDPEIVSGNYTTIGIDRGIYPQSRTISLGANISF